MKNAQPQDTCPDRKRQDTHYMAITTDSRTHCLVLNVQEGPCYDVARTATPADCADPTATVKVAKRVDGVTESSNVR